MRTGQFDDMLPTLARRDFLCAATVLGSAAGLFSGAGLARSSAVTSRATALLAPGTRIEMGIRFVSDNSGLERGHERVTYAFNLDGSITMSARSESFDPPVVRDVIYLLGPDFRPLSCSVQITNAGRPAGAGWYRLTEDMAELEGIAGGKRISRQQPLNGPVRALVAHPVSSDVFVGMAADKSQPGKVVRADGVYLTSADPYGRTGPEFVAANVAVAYLGIEQVTTPIGRMPADHYLLYLPAANGRFAPFQDLWCAVGTPVFLKAYARPPVATRYEISSLEIAPA